MIPLSLYVHIPWCEKKCPYCDFNSHLPRFDVSDIQAQTTYVEALLNDLAYDLERFKTQIGSRAIHSIFIGGGTPSLFSSKAISKLLLGIRDLIELEPDAEITLESNPGSSEASKFEGFLKAGVNRLSIGIQSFNNDALSKLGRIHSAKQAIDAANAAKHAGFKRLNLDIMFGLPNQSLQNSIDDIEQAIELKPDHISAYELTLEPNTLFHHQPPKLPKDDAKWQMYSEIQARLANANFEQYEVSAYAQANQQCRHNRNYWEFGDYLGIGAGAHSKITNADFETITNFEIVRSWKIKHPESYLKAFSDPESAQAGIGDTNIIPESDLAFEFMLNAMRLSNGFSTRLFEQRTGLKQEAILATLEKHQGLGLITHNNSQIKISSKGKRFIDTMLQDYL